MLIVILLTHIHDPINHQLINGDENRLWYL
ncbi:unnamed protein product, partial [Rotaria sp. Silwood2]